MSKRIRVALLTALAVAALVFAVASVVARARPISSVGDLILAVGSPYVALVALAGLVVALSCRRFGLSILAVAVIASCVAVQVSWYYLGYPTAAVSQDLEIRVLSSNLRYGQADPSFFVRFAEQNADVITVAELTPEAVQRFTEAGIEKTFIW